MDVISNSPFSQKISDNDDEEIWQNISFMNLIKNDVTAPMKEAENRKKKRQNYNQLNVCFFALSMKFWIDVASTL